MISERHSQAARENIARACVIRKARRVTKQCETCGAQMTLPPSVAATKRFCSWACRKTGMVGTQAANYGHGEKIRGRKNPNYKTGTESGRTTGDKGRRFRRYVLRRDGYRCIVCGSGGPLHAHHIDGYASFPLLHGDSSNGVTLCVPCHKKAHSKTGGYGFITKEGRMILRFPKRKRLPPNGSMRHTAIGTFILGWKA